MKAILLSRVSTDEQIEALPAQTSRLKEYARGQDFDDYELYEFDESAYKRQRKKFKSVIKGLEKSDKKIALCCDKIDRLVRNFTMELVTLEKLRKRGQIEMHFPADNIVLHKDSPASDLFRFTIGVSLAKYYSDSISDNVKRKNEEMLRNGKLPGKAPFGYENVELENGEKWIETKSLEAKAVKSAFDWYTSELYSLQQISEKIEEEYSIELSKSQVYNVIKNPFYHGEILRTGDLYPHNYETLITKQQYDEAQQVLNGHNKKNFKYKGLPFPYRGLITCDECGCSITPERTKGYHYYHCTEYHGKHDAEYVREEELTKQIKDVFESIRVPDDVLEQCLGVIKSSHESKKKHQQELRSDLEAKHARIQTRLEKMYDDKLDGIITEEMYRKKYDEYREKQADVKDKIDSLETADDEYYQKAEQLLNLINGAPEIFEEANLEQKRHLINFTLQNLRLQGDNLLCKVKEPFDIFQKCANRSDWLPDLDSNQDF